MGQKEPVIQLVRYVRHSQILFQIVSLLQNKSRICIEMNVIIWKIWELILDCRQKGLLPSPCTKAKIPVRTPCQKNFRSIDFFEFYQSKELISKHQYMRLLGRSISTTKLNWSFGNVVLAIVKVLQSNIPAMAGPDRIARHNATYFTTPWSRLACRWTAKMLRPGLDRRPWHQFLSGDCPSWPENAVLCQRTDCWPLSCS